MEQSGASGVQDTLMQALKTVYDPEIPVNIVDLGLVYDVAIHDGNVEMKMTLTTPGCGMGAMIAGSAEQALKTVPGVKDAKVEIVWEPKWNPQMMSDEAKQKLGFA